MGGRNVYVCKACGGDGSAPDRVDHSTDCPNVSIYHECPLCKSRLNATHSAPTSPAPPSPGDVLAWVVYDRLGRRCDEFWADRWSDAEAKAHESVRILDRRERKCAPHTVVPLGRLAARPQPMTTRGPLSRMDADFLVTDAMDRVGFDPYDKGAREMAVAVLRMYEERLGIAHPSPAGAGDDTTDTTTRET
jgi:hypothetical protein